MEDGVTEAEKLLHPLNLSPRSQAKEEEENHEELSKTNHEGGEERASGLINHLISNLVSGGEADEEKDDKDQHEKEQRETVTEGKDEVKGDGLLGHLMSNFFHQSEGEEKRTEEEGGGGRGIIDNIVSHLPTSLPDDAAPTTDEASILIHSIIHD